MLEVLDRKSSGKATRFGTGFHGENSETSHSEMPASSETIGYGDDGRMPPPDSQRQPDVTLPMNAAAAAGAWRS